MVTSINGIRRKVRTFYQKILLVSLLLCVSIFMFSYINLEFCYKILSASSLNHMCLLYKYNQYSGSLCEEICNGNSFKDFKCPKNSMKTTVFTTVKNNDVYAIKLAKNIKDDLTWRDKNGNQRYPKMNDLQNIIKRYIIISYNITIDDTVINALLSQEINEHYPEQMMNLWRLFKDNNYMLSKLFDEELILPNILGSCGPYYATENLNSIQPMRHFITIDWEGRLKFSIMILDFLYRLDSIKPEPLKICKIEPIFFGLTADKRIKYQSAQYINSEIQIDKILANGKVCESNKDCTYQNCLGKCEMKICSGPQQNNNLQIVCEHIFKGTVLFPGLLATAKAPSSLITILNTCIDPSKNKNNHIVNKPFAPTIEIGIKLYNLIKGLQNTLTFQQ